MPRRLSRRESSDYQQINPLSTLWIITNIKIITIRAAKGHQPPITISNNSVLPFHLLFTSLLQTYLPSILIQYSNVRCCLTPSSSFPSSSFPFPFLLLSVLSCTNCFTKDETARNMRSVSERESDAGLATA